MGVNKNIGDLIAAFRPQASAWKDPEEAVGGCAEASIKFVWFARDHRLPARRIILNGLRSPLLVYPDCDARWQAVDDHDHWNHYVAWVNGKIVDWTARQYEPKAAFPVVHDTLHAYDVWTHIFVEDREWEDGCFDEARRSRRLFPVWFKVESPIMSTKKNGTSTNSFRRSGRGVIVPKRNLTRRRAATNLISNRNRGPKNAT